MKLFQIIIFFSLSTFYAFPQVSIEIHKYGILFDTIQLQQVFHDQKTFVDVRPKYAPDKILQQYNAQKNKTDFNLKDFVGQNFDTVFADTSDVLKHIDLMWDYLKREPDSNDGYSTLIPLKHPYIVPGGRFREIYYWDTYFTMLGLEVAGKLELIENMLDNIADLINSYGHMPNGNRTYYLSRSQPPFFSLMVELYAESTQDPSVYKKYYSALKKEHDFWTKGKVSIDKPFTAKFRMVQLEKREFLNRYWDNKNQPRPESFMQDVEVMHAAGNDTGVYRNIRAAAESGWDFSSRWFNGTNNLTNINTTDVVPVDLNCLLYHLETILSRSCSNPDSINHYSELAKVRKKMIIKYCWSEEKGFFFDYNLKDKKHTGVYSLAALYPLYFEIADIEMAKKLADKIVQDFLKEGGLVTTLNATGQQWDWPNGWPPLQWIGYSAFSNYGFNVMAKSIAQRWIRYNARVYFQTYKMMEKYNVVDVNKPGGGGEYDLQDGFGWTNGVFLKLWDEMH